VAPGPIPSIIAESLVAVPDPLFTALRPGPPASAVAVASALAQSLRPAEHPVQPPSWLLGQQGTSFRRVLAAIHRYGGALLADPVGSGKTFVALAVAAQLNQGKTACLVPSALVTQWKAAAARLDIPVSVHSHEQVSRARLPERTAAFVIVDESHHFRNSHTRRYRHLAPWLVGRRVLLLTATPIVNHGMDLAHQLLLAVRDDALRLQGVDSIRMLLRRNCSSPALGQLVFENENAVGPRPQRVSSRSEAGQLECAALGRAVELLDSLRLSQSQTLADLLRGVFLRAIASSPAAFKERLLRYRRLLLHASDALRAGYPLDRSELKRFTGELDGQLVWWELLPVMESSPEIELEDLDRLGQAIEELDHLERDHDPKLERMLALLSDGTPTLVFTGYRATVRYIRDRLPALKVAWCTGDRAGIGMTPLSRHTVLDWFRAPQSSVHAPTHLVVTDVAAEGLDLQRVARVVHYDLPWTPMRLEQREGRAVRYGSRHSHVAVVQFGLPSLLETRLGLTATLTRKSRLPGVVGLGPSGRHVWRWRAELAERCARAEPVSGVASVTDPHSPQGLLVGFALHAAGDSRPLAVSVLWMDEKGGWTETPEVIEARLVSAAAQQIIRYSDERALREQLILLSRIVRRRLAALRSRRWLLPEAAPAAPRVLALLQQLVGQAARRHDHRALADLERAIAFVSGGHTAGEAALVRRLSEAPGREFLSLLKTLPSGSAEVDQIEARLTGLIRFSPAKTASRSIASPECPPSKPCCSTSTEP